MTSYRSRYGGDPDRSVQRDLHRRLTKVEGQVERLIGRVKVLKLAVAAGGDSDRVIREEE